jgi:hypothetical protein
MANATPGAQAASAKTGPIFWGGIAVGLTLLIAGILTLMWNALGAAEGRLILCSGLGVLFGAFGSTATVKYKGITITGVAAIAIALLCLVAKLTADKATFGRITGDVRGSQIEVVGDYSYLGAMQERDYEFVVRGEHLERPVFDVYITFPADEFGEGEEENPIVGIDKKHLEEFMKSGKRIEWRFDRDEQILVRAETGETIGQVESPFGNNFREPAGGSWSLIEPAWAQPAPRGVREIIEDLGSGSSRVRRLARNELAAEGPSAIAPMMATLRGRGSAYRIRVGILFALNKMLTANPAQVQDVSGRLTPQDLELIASYLNDRDRTVRLYATECLRNMDDPRVIDPVLSVAADSLTSPDAVRLSSYVIDGAAEQLAPSQRQETQMRFEQVMRSLNPLFVTVSAGPPTVSRGQRSTILVAVHDQEGRPVPGAAVTVSAGGGKFLAAQNDHYDPDSRLHEPYSASGVTNQVGVFTSWWVCNPCAAAYGLSVRATKEGFLDGNGEIEIEVH